MGKKVSMMVVTPGSFIISFYFVLLCLDRLVCVRGGVIRGAVVGKVVTVLRKLSSLEVICKLSITNPCINHYAKYINLPCVVCAYSDSLVWQVHGIEFKGCNWIYGSKA